MNPYLLITDITSKNLINCAQIRHCSDYNEADEVGEWIIYIQWIGLDSTSENELQLCFSTRDEQQRAFTEITRKLGEIGNP